MIGTFWAFVPAIIAIVLALITKQVYVSLFIGIFIGAMFLAGGNPISALGIIFQKMAEEIGGSGTILVFLVMLGILVILMTKAGGSRAYGNWATGKIKKRSTAIGATVGLGSLIFVDDYFNCLTVGSVMRPVTDKYKVSHAKLAYIIDATAAPICIIAPISSWAAAVTGELEGNGLVAFIKTIPFNMYALLTLAMIIFVVVTGFDFGKMRKNEIKAMKGDLYAGETDLPSEDVDGITINNRGRVFDLILPVVVLIFCCIGSMIYTGYFPELDTAKPNPDVTNIALAFANCNSGLSLAIGSTIAVIFTALLYIPRKLVSFRDFTDSFVQGFKSMVPAILILVLAWTISSVIGENGLDAPGFVKSVVSSDSMALGIMPAVFFIIAVFVSFATGTSWGTFGILIPIATAVLGVGQTTPTILCISATLAGAVVGDHISPISDTTILASSGAQCNHVDHVKTQMPYALLVAGVCFITYIVVGFVAQSGIGYGGTVAIGLSTGFVLLFGILVPWYIVYKKKGLLPAQVAARELAAEGVEQVEPRAESACPANAVVDCASVENVDTDVAGHVESDEDDGSID